MGEGIIVVSINGTAYIIKTGHNNQDLKAIDIALKKHKEILDKENEHYRVNNIKDKDGVPITISYDVNEIYVCGGVEV